MTEISLHNDEIPTHLQTFFEPKLCDGCYTCHTVQILREIRRVLRKDGTVWWNIGDSYASSPVGSFNGGGACFTGRDMSGIATSGNVDKVKASGLKPKDLCMIPFRVALAVQADGWWVRSDIVWCLSHSTRVYARTQKGTMPMTVGEMVRLRPSTVELWAGKRWVRARGWSKSATINGIELTFRNGFKVSSTANHKWPTPLGDVQTSDLRIGDVLLGANLPSGDHDTPSFPDRFGFIVGLYIAEGSRASGDGLQFSLHAKEINLVDRIREFAEHFGSSCQTYVYGNSRHVKVRGGFAGPALLNYISGNGAKHKHLSTDAWQRSNDFLRGILMGYLFGDGHKEGTRWRVGFTRNDIWADDLRTMGARLNESIRLKRAWFTNQTGRFYGFRGDIKLKPEERRRSDWEIVAVHKSKSEAFWDIGIEEPNVFALSCGLLTHNSKPNPMPESVTDRPTKSHEYIFLFTKSKDYYFDADAVREEAKPESYARYDYAFGGKKNIQLKATDKPTATVGMRSPSGRNIRSVWEIATAPFAGAHFATYPPALVERCIKAGTSERGMCPICGTPWVRVIGPAIKEERKLLTPKRSTADKAEVRGADGGFGHGPGWREKHYSQPQTIAWKPTCNCPEHIPVPCIVLDPFAGSGTTLRVARDLGRHAIGIDISDEYKELAKHRAMLNYPDICNYKE